MSKKQRRTFTDEQKSALRYRILLVLWASRNAPPLLASAKMSRKAATLEFEWENVEGVWAKFEEELAEFKAALEIENWEHQTAELGDLLFTVINLARWHGLDCEQALDGTNQRFIQRLQVMESVADKPLADYTLAELETLWQSAKKTLAQTSHPPHE